MKHIYIILSTANSWDFGVGLICKQREKESQFRDSKTKHISVTACLLSLFCLQVLYLKAARSAWKPEKSSWDLNCVVSSFISQQTLIRPLPPPLILQVWPVHLFIVFFYIYLLQIFFFSIQYTFVIPVFFGGPGCDRTNTNKY